MPTPSTQAHLDIRDIKENLVVLKGGSIAMVVETNALNFELLAEEEQEVRIASFSDLLNAVNFPMQLVVRTERANMDDYIEKLIAKRASYKSKALRKQMEIYIKFVRNLITKTDILNKRFFLVVRYKGAVAKQSKSLMDGIMGGSKSSKSEEPINLDKARDYLYPKRNFLMKQFKKMGMKAKQLNNDELIQLYYEIYDPDKIGIKKAEITEKEYTSGLVGQKKEAFVDDLIGGEEGGIE